jgi:hypothetical protein
MASTFLKPQIKSVTETSHRGAAGIGADSWGLPAGGWRRPWIRRYQLLATSPCACGASVAKPLSSIRPGAELEDATTRIALELRHQYSIGYVPYNENRKGEWRKIRVKVNPPRGLPALSVRAKEGYYALPQ